MDLTVEVVFAPEARSVTLPAGATLADALAAAGFSARGLKTGIFGALAGPETLLKDGDRVEIYRPLAIDPKEARRRRAAGGRARKSRV
jgi:hypothetical protein